MRRLAYAVGSPLIPVVILSRVYKGVREVARRENLPAATIPAIIFGAMLKAVGEMRGYLLGAPDSAEKGMTDFEIKKLAFNAGEKV